MALLKILLVVAVTISVTISVGLWNSHGATQSSDEATKTAPVAQNEPKAVEVDVSKLTASQLTEAGGQCVSAIAKEFSNSKSYDWSFLDLNPSEFDGIKSATLMGLGLTAADSGVAPTKLVTSQVEWVLEVRKSYPQYAEMRFVLSKRVDSFGGLKEVVSLYSCQIQGTQDVETFESGSIVLN